MTHKSTSMAAESSSGSTTDEGLSPEALLFLAKAGYTIEFFSKHRGAWITSQVSHATNPHLTHISRNLQYRVKPP